MIKERIAYLDTCVYSYLLEPEFVGLRRTLRDMPHRVVFSDVHLAEMKGEVDGYSELIEELGALFIRNPGVTNNQYHPIACLESADIETRFKEAASWGKIQQAYEEMLHPMHHFLGGRRDLEIQDVSEDAADKIQELILDYIVENVPAEHRASIDLELDRIHEASKSMEELDVDEVWLICDAQVKAARQGDPMRNMTPMEKVQHLFSSLSPSDYKGVTTSFPPRFAREKILEVGELTGFAFMLFSLGLTKRKGIFSGSAQERKFSAQYRDCRHIEEAALCNDFVTFDHGAAELALVTYAYSGFNTRSVLLEAGKKAGA